MKRSSYNHRITSCLTLLVTATITTFALSSQKLLACGDGYGELKLFRLARQAMSDDAAQAQAAIKELREAGPAGLDTLLQVHAAILHPPTQQVQGPPAPALPVVPTVPAVRPESYDAKARLAHVADQVSRQRDCLYSRLYWHTDLEKAKAAARIANKPILSLRLLGNLDEELSCANSRFFRTALYANAEVSKALRERFVLHWESVRPVPRLTIDFGDGRRLERTITGNSIHYVLDQEGRPVDALPGLYGPQAFLSALDRAAYAALKFHELPEANRESFLVDWHRDRLAAIEQQWNQDLIQVGFKVTEPPAALVQSTAQIQAPQAADGARVSVGKRALEAPVIHRLLPPAPSDSKTLRAAMTDHDWTRVAALHAEDSKLDQGSRTLMAQKIPEDADAAMRRAFSKSRVENPILKTMREFERSMAEDTVRNEYQMHTAIHQWFTEHAAATRDLPVLNDKVYAELFLTPKTDPWLGLKPANVYSALDGDGVVATTR